MGTLVGNKGLEPLHLMVLEPKSSASANSANPPGGVPHEFYYTLDSGAVLESAPAYIYEKRYAKTSLSAFITIDSDRWRERRDLNPRPTD